MNRKELLMFSIGVFLTVMAWLIADIRHAATSEKMKVKTAIPTLKKYEIKQDTLTILKEKKE